MRLIKITLDDKFNPNDGSFIDRADNRLFEFSKGIAKLWQDKTYRLWHCAFF